MSDFLASLSLIDLISEKHKELRSLVLEQVRTLCEHPIAEHELYLLSLIRYQPLSISEAARFMKVSRQAAHKSTKHLIELGYVAQSEDTQNRRQARLQLTAQGELLYQKTEGVKQALQQQLSEKIGHQQLQQLCQLLQQQWL